MILISLGSNLRSQFGDPAANLHLGIATLQSADVNVIATSPFYETPAWPNPSDPTFINAICKIGTEIAPEELLSRLHDIENRLGRQRTTRYSPRTLDLDIIDCDGRIQKGPPTLPHPSLESRGFVLIPLRDVAPDWRHPVSGRTVDELIAELSPQARIARRVG